MSSFYPSCEVDEALRCAFCGSGFADTAKLIPDCGNSVCVACHEALLARLIKSREYECRACTKWHTMPPPGLADNQVLIKLLRLQPERRALPQKAQELQTLIGETRRLLTRVVDANGVDEVNDYCDRLREQVAASIEARVAELRRAGDEHLREVDAYRSELLNALLESQFARPAKRLKRLMPVGAALDELKAELEAFCRGWDEYFTRLSKVASDAELERANSVVRAFAPRIQELGKRKREESFGGHFLRWDENSLLVFSRSQLGKLVHEEESPPSPPKSKPVPELKPEKTSPKVESAAAATAPSEQTESCRFINIYNLEKRTSPLGSKAAELVKTTAALPGGRLAAGCADGTVKIWDPARSEAVRCLKAHSGAVFALRLLQDGRLASAARDNTIKIWNWEQGVLVATMTGHDASAPNDSLHIQTLANGQLLTCLTTEGTRDCFVKLWDPQTGVLVRTIGTKYQGVSAALVLADGRLALGGHDGRIRLFDLAQETETRTLAKCHDTRVHSMVQLPNGNLVSCGSRTDTTLKIWDLASGRLVKLLITGHKTSVQSLSLSKNGQVLASTSVDNKVKFWFVV